ncbi:MAG: hypothetical protein VB961_15220 [Dehalococcoidia bacterium]
MDPTTVFISYFEDAPITSGNKLRMVRSADYGVTFVDPATVDTYQTVGEHNDISLAGTTNVFGELLRQHSRAWIRRPGARSTVLSQSEAYGRPQSSACPTCDQIHRGPSQNGECLRAVAESCRLIAHGLHLPNYVIFSLVKT